MGVTNSFLGQSIVIARLIHFSKKKFLACKLWRHRLGWFVGVRGCVRSSGISTTNLNSLALVYLVSEISVFTVPEISAFIQMDYPDGQTDERTWLDRLGSDPDQEYKPLWGRKRCYMFPTNLVHPLTLRVTGIKRENAIVDGLVIRYPLLT